MAKGKYEYWLTKEGRTLIEGWARDGLTDKQIAHNMGISYSTLRVWRDKYSALSAALKKGKEVIDREVENALLKRALGYKYKETTKERTEQRDSEGKLVSVDLSVTKVVEKEVVPDVTAQIFWLKNRKPEEWRDKREVENKEILDKLLSGVRDIFGGVESVIE